MKGIYELELIKYVLFCESYFIVGQTPESSQSMLISSRSPGFFPPALPGDIRD